MSFHVNVAVHAADWPTAQKLQQCLNQQRFPVKLTGVSGDAWNRPLERVPYTLGMPVTFRGRALELEVSMVTLSPAKSYGYSLRGLEPADIRQDFQALGVEDVTFGYGDHVLTYSVRRTDGEWRAGNYVMAAMIRCFRGYAFETRGMTHGGESYSDELVADAEAPASDENP